MRKRSLTIWMTRVVLLAVLFSMMSIGNCLAVSAFAGHDQPAPVCEMLQADEPDALRQASADAVVVTLPRIVVTLPLASLTMRHLCTVILQPPEAA